MPDPGSQPRALRRREFVASGAAALGALAAGPSRAPAQAPRRRPNLLLILCDQLNLDGLSALGNPHVQTPHLDRLAARGTLFLESHSTNPVCSPARSSLMTGRMPVETGVVQNDLRIRADLPNLGEWLGAQAGYQTAYCGKWHLPGGIHDPLVKGFQRLAGGGGQGAHDDHWVTQACEAYLHERAARRAEPFLLVASYMQPHDICYWMIHPETLVSDRLPYPQLADRLPALPPNHKSRPPGPAKADKAYTGFTTDEQWRYYLYAYYRMVEMLDADVGRLLEALDETGLADDTIVIFTADHGEGAGRHGNVQKWHPYDESMKVPFVVAGPGVTAGARDATHLVSGIDVMGTFCDYAGVPLPAPSLSRSVRPLLEGRAVDWRDHLVSEFQGDGRIIRTARHKLVTVAGDPAVQLFDLQADPWETRNLADQPGAADLIASHRKLLDAWNRQMDVCPTT